MVKNFFKKIKENVHYAVSISAILSILFIGTLVYHYLENWSWIEALYFTVVTLATVGYGDLHPTTDTSRLFTIFFIIFGVTIGISSIAYIGGQYLTRREEALIRRKESETDQKNKN